MGGWGEVERPRPAPRGRGGSKGEEEGTGQGVMEGEGGMWEGSRGRGRDERRGGERRGVQSPLAEHFFWEVQGLISRTWTLLPAPRAPLSQR